LNGGCGEGVGRKARRQNDTAIMQALNRADENPEAIRVYSRPSVILCLRRAFQRAAGHAPMEPQSVKVLTMYFMIAKIDAS
jgi:hypothetical protein